jgi:hypothetical protein
MVSSPVVAEGNLNLIQNLLIKQMELGIQKKKKPALNYFVKIFVAKL